MWRYRRARLFQNFDRHIPRNTGEIGEKLIKSVAGLKIVEQILDRYAGASEDGSAMKNFRGYPDKSALDLSRIFGASF